MSRLQMTSKSRTDLRKSETKRIRREGGVPGTVYSRGEEARSIEIRAEELAAILKTPGGRLSLIDLKIDGKATKAHPVLIQAVQREPISKKAIHIDFHRVSMDEPVHASVPLVLIGDAPGTHLGGILEQVVPTFDIRALPDHMPTHINVDVSKLALGQSVHVSDVPLPSDVELLHPQQPESVVATVRMPIVRAEEAAVTEELAPEAAEAP
jgi:large subunit ribosomal protein L25